MAGTYDPCSEESMLAGGRQVKAIVRIVGHAAHVRVNPRLVFAHLDFGGRCGLNRHVGVAPAGAQAPAVPDDLHHCAQKLMRVRR